MPDTLRVRITRIRQPNVDSGTEPVLRLKGSPRSSNSRNAATFFLQGPASEGRLQLERLVAEKFARVHGASISEFLPHLVGVAETDYVHSIAGLRFAAKGSLFLEQYLDRPIEQAISDSFRVPVDRCQIVEVGNLVSGRAGAATSLFALLPAILHSAGVRWVACSATPAVRALLAGLDFPSRVIADADPGALANGAGNWGRYYETRPVVIAGSVEAALRKVPGTMRLSSLNFDQARELSELADALRQARR